MSSANIVVFGAGEAARRAIVALDASVRVLAVCDNDVSKHGKYFAGHRIIAPSEIAGLAPDRVLIASMYWKEIAAQLRALGLRDDQIEIDNLARGAAPARPATVGAPHVTTPVLPEWMSADLRMSSATGEPDPLVSIVLPTRNRAHVLSRAIDSVLAQSHSHWELLIVDDGSSDGSADVLAEYCQRDRRIRVFRQQPAGVSAARNRGLTEARGELIAYIDSDNRWHSSYLEMMVRGFRDSARATGYSGFNIFDLQTGRFLSNVPVFDFEQLQQSNRIDLNTFMHRRLLVDRYGGFNERMTRLVDWELILRYTRQHPPFAIGCVLADYYKEATGGRITDTEPFLENRHEMRRSLTLNAPRAERLPGPLRVAFVQYEFPVLSQTFVQDEIARLLELGMEVSVFHFRDAFKRADIPTHWDVAKYSSREHLTWLLTSRSVDLVHTHFAMPHPADYIVPVCERLGIPFTIKPHAFDIFRNDHDARHDIAKTAAHSLCRAVFCEGEFHRRFLQAKGIAGDKLLVARNVFEIEKFLSSARAVRPRIERIMAISRFVEKKGLHLLIPAFRELTDPELRLELYGYGEERERLLSLADGDGRILIADGPRTPAEAAALLARADLFVLPCVVDRRGDTDGLPTVLMEAMAVGVPVVTTPIASTPDLVIDGKTGLLVESGSTSALADGLRKAISLAPDERDQLVEAAREHLLDEFDPGLNVRRLMLAWQQITPLAMGDGVLSIRSCEVENLGQIARREGTTGPQLSVSTPR